MMDFGEVKGEKNRFTFGKATYLTCRGFEMKLVWFFSRCGSKFIIFARNSWIRLSEDVSRAWFHQRFEICRRFLEKTVVWLPSHSKKNNKKSSIYQKMPSFIYVLLHLFSPLALNFEIENKNNHFILLIKKKTIQKVNRFIIKSKRI